MRRRPRRAEMVADAKLVSLAAVRQAVKNIVLVRTLRDSVDYDAGWYADAARRELEHLASEAVADAERLHRARKTASALSGRAEHATDYRSADTKGLKRRERVLTELAEALRAIADDPDAVAGIVSEARTNALDEIASTFASVPGLGRVEPASGLARSRALKSLKEELSDYAD